jgi:hypothetical protein
VCLADLSGCLFSGIDNYQNREKFNMYVREVKQQSIAAHRVILSEDSRFLGLCFR